MTRYLKQFVLAGLVFGMAAGSLVHCDCDPSTKECDLAVDCEGRSWPADVDCNEADGYWECMNLICVPVCNSGCSTDAECDDSDICTTDTCDANGACQNDEIGNCCTAVADCEGDPWPEGLCSEADGWWECNSDVCEAICPDCVTGPDCDGNTWPGDAECDEADGEWQCNDNVCETFCPECVLDEDCPELPGCEGNATGWECLDGTCSPVCCENDADCTEWLWEEACVGHFQCDRDTCSRICDDVGCGDDTCDAGENTDTCPADCLLACADANACTIYDFPLPCSGYWTCDAGECGGVCDYNSCGDGSCEQWEGPACPEDCLTQYCVGDESCALTKGWPAGCEGHWDCLAGVYTCTAQCDGPCGNGICEPVEGEDGETCPSDCVVGPCQLGVADCFLNAWDAPRGTLCAGLGHWVCDEATATCDRVCEQGDCGDGTCDPTMGESPDSCPTDCTDYDCLDASDCDALTLPAGCDAGQWQCFRKVCWPDC